MRAVVQRVRRASIVIDGVQGGSIDAGYVILLGVGHEDTLQDVERLWNKIFSLRIMQDEQGKTNRALADVDGAVLVVSQFTLYANCKKGNRPSFIESGDPKAAEELYEYIIESCKAQVPVVERGRFGADMKVSLINDGPFTIVLDSREL